MRRTNAIVLALLLASVALAGCTGGDEPEPTPTTATTPEPTPSPEPTPATPTPTPATPTPTPATPSPALDSSSYQLATVGMPTMAKPGQRWNFTLYVNGSLTRESDHIGAHYADNDTVNPPGTGRRDCEHVGGELPGVFTVACTIHTNGTWHVWGHARINDSGELRNWWTAAPTVVKVLDHNVSLSGVPTNAVLSGANFTVTVNLTGAQNVTSDHIGVHYWNATTAEPSLQNAQGGCQHVAGGSVGTYTITCAITNAGIAPKEFYLRGHLRLAEAGTQLNWWSMEYPVTIGPSLPMP